MKNMQFNKYFTDVAQFSGARGFGKLRTIGELD
jgi:hypothetical protein